MNTKSTQKIKRVAIEVFAEITISSIVVVAVIYGIMSISKISATPFV